MVLATFIEALPITYKVIFFWTYIFASVKYVEYGNLIEFYFYVNGFEFNISNLYSWRERSFHE